MSLSNDLLSQFVKATKDNKKNSTGATVYGTIIYDGRPYVKLDGSDLLTPVSTTASVQDGERVTVSIQNHTATVTGNMSSPSASGNDVKEMGDKITEFEIVLAAKVSATDLEAINATIENLVAMLASIGKLEAVEADIEKLLAMFADVEHLTAGDIEAILAIIETLRAEFGEFTDLSTENLDALYAEIDHLVAYTAEFTYVSAEVLEAMKASIKELDVEKLSVEDADVRYANIDFSNIGEAAIKNLFTESGIIKDLIISDGTVTGELVGVTIRGDLIAGGTIMADKLVVKGEDGLYYKLNIEAGVVASEEVTDEELQNGLHGDAIIAKSVTAEKIAVDDLVAFGATIGGFHITTDSLYSGVKESATNTTRGVYLDNEGQLSVGDGSNFLRYFKDTDGNYKLEISAASLVFSSSGKSVEEAIEDASDVEVGARNLIRNSKNLIFEDYYFITGYFNATHDDMGNVYIDSNSVWMGKNGDDVKMTVYGHEVTHDGDGNVTLN